jgi:hypothetical protein
MVRPVDSFFLKKSHNNNPKLNEKAEGIIKADTFTLSAG